MLTAVLALALQASAPVLISTLDGGKLKGEPTELAWSGDGTQLFLQTNERDSSGMVKAPGVAVLAVIGNIVTSWSWFGTNMLGVGLHSYGFMAGAVWGLVGTVLAFLAIAVTGMFLPKRAWG